MYRVRDSRELQAVVLLFAAAQRTVRNGMRRAVRRQLNATWRPALQARPATRLQARVLVRGARVDIKADGSFDLLAATSTRALRGGLIPADEWHGPEFGAVDPKLRQFGPRRSTGKVVYPAARKVGPDAVAALVDGAVGGLLQGTPHALTT